MPTSRSSNVPSPNGTPTGPRHLVAASTIFKRTRTATEDEVQVESDEQLHGTAPPGGAAHRVVNNADLARKLAWAVGSSLGIPYGRRSALHEYFEGCADQLLVDMGLAGP